ncbi:MAG: hypothetical protein ACK5LX_01155 [Oscillospiraceae bacterium]
MQETAIVFGVGYDAVFDSCQYLLAQSYIAVCARDDDPCSLETPFRITELGRAFLQNREKVSEEKRKALLFGRINLAIAITGVLTGIVALFVSILK